MLLSQIHEIWGGVSTCYLVLQTSVIRVHQIYIDKVQSL